MLIQQPTMITARKLYFIAVWSAATVLYDDKDIWVKYMLKYRALNRGRKLSNTELIYGAAQLMKRDNIY